MGSSKGELKPFKSISSGDMSADITSVATHIGWLDNVAVQLIFTGTPVGTFSIQGSLDYNQDAFGNVHNTGTWTTLTLSPAPAAAGSGDNILINLNQLAFPWIRVKYTKSSGTGTLNAYISGKQL